MTNYVGAQCPVCNKKFAPEDDIVVCPTCGAPHHRACYAMENHCAFESEHITGKTWKPPVESTLEGDFCINPQDGVQWDGQGIDAKTCPYCGSKNPKDNLFCCSCGNRLVQIDNPQGFQPQVLGGFLGIDPSTAMYGGVSPADTIGEFSVREVATFVGRSSAYYIPQFKAESEDKRRFSFSFSAFILQFLYFFYRKMYLVGISVLAISIALSIPSLLNYKENFPLVLKDMVGVETLEQMGIDVTASIDNIDQVKAGNYARIANYTNAINMVFRFALGLFGTKMYYHYTMKKMKKNKEKEEYVGEGENSALAHQSNLQKAGGVNTWIGPVVAISYIIGATVFVVQLMNAYGMFTMLK